MTLRLLSLALVTSTAMAFGSPGAFAGNGDQHPHRRVTVSGECHECNFAGQNLSDAMIIGAQFDDSDFSHATLINAGLQECVFRDTDLSDSNFSGARLSGVAFVDSDLGNAHLTGIQGDRVRFTSSRLEGTDLSRGRFVLVSFNDADLSQAILAGSEFHHAEFTEATLDRTVFRSARLARANFREATGDRTEFVNADLRAADFTGAHFDRPDFTGAQLDGANFSGAQIRRARGLTAQQLAGACGDADTALPDSLTVAICPPLPQRSANGVFFVSRTDGRVQVIDQQRMIEAQTAAVEALREVETRMSNDIEIEFRRSGDLREVRRAISEALNALRREQEGAAAQAEMSAAEAERSEAELAAARDRLEALELFMRNHNIPREFDVLGESFAFTISPDGTVAAGENAEFGYRWEFRTEPREEAGNDANHPVEPPLPPMPPKPVDVRPRSDAATDAH